MIQKVDDSFPVPVSGKPIQQGWFGALVRFVNSLRLRGDGRYFMVSRNLGGTTIAPSNALLQALNRSGGAAPSEGGGTGTTYGIEATIDGSTASVELVSGGTVSTFRLIPGTDISLTAGSNPNEVVVNYTGGGGGSLGFPKYNDNNEVTPVPFVDGYYSAPFDGWMIGTIEQIDFSTTAYTCLILLDNTIYQTLGGASNDSDMRIYTPVMIPLKQGQSITFMANDDEFAFTDFHFVHCL